MIINTGARTDTVQYYTPWLINRFREGYVYVRNHLFPETVTKYDLSPDMVDVVLFCSKNYAPILPHLHEIYDRFRVYCYYTVTAYGKDVEPGVPSIDESIETLIALSKQIGKNKVAWRYDPVLLTKNYTVETHLQTFEYMAGKLAPHIDRCIFSFVEMYKKTAENMPEIIPLTAGDRDILAQGFGAIAQKYGIHIQTCGKSEDYTRYGINYSGCATLKMFSSLYSCEFKDLLHKGTREGCHCIESRDIGQYNTCPNGCKYCYANDDPKAAIKNYGLHDPKSPILLGAVQPTDKITNPQQKSFINSVAKQVSLFDF